MKNPTGIIVFYKIPILDIVDDYIIIFLSSLPLSLFNVK